MDEDKKDVVEVEEGTEEVVPATETTPTEAEEVAPEEVPATDAPVTE